MEIFPVLPLLNICLLEVICKTQSASAMGIDAICDLIRILETKKVPLLCRLYRLSRTRDTAWTMIDLSAYKYRNYRLEGPNNHHETQVLLGFMRLFLAMCT